MFICIGTKRWPTTLSMPNCVRKEKTASKNDR